MNSSKPEISILPKTWEIPDAIRQRMGREAGPQRAIFEEGHLLVILHQAPEPHATVRHAAVFWRTPEGEWRSTLGGLAIPAMQKVLKLYETKLETLEAAEQKASTAVSYHDVLERLAPVARAARGLHKALQQAREFVREDRELLNFRDAGATIERTSELLLQDAQLGLNFTMARQAETQAESAKKMAATGHRLNLLAALFLPLTALASIFGMEIHSGLSNTPAMFVGICLAGVVVGIALAMLITHRGE